MITFADNDDNDVCLYLQTRTNSHVANINELYYICEIILLHMRNLPIFFHLRDNYTPFGR